MKHRLRLFVVAHAGDGNIHPGVPFDPGDAEEVARLHAFDRELQEACLALGGSITGEHGVGIEKREGVRRQYTPPVLEWMEALRRAFDPDLRLNRGKALPERTGGW